MTLDLTKPVEVMPGNLPTRILYPDHVSGAGRPIVAAVKDSDGYEQIYLFPLSGIGPRYRIVNIPERKSVFMNVYKSGDIATMRQSKASADLAARGDRRIGIMEIVLEDDIPTAMHMHMDSA